jgi:transcriptional regulator with XRE-family HTH domain
VEGSPSRSGQPGYSAMGDHLRAARRRRHLSLRELAGRLGLSPSLISQVETGRAKPSVSTLYAIANELDVSLDELLFNDASRAGRTGDAALRVVSTEDASAPPVSASEPVQRADDRKVIRLASGVVWERLTTDSVPGIDFLYVTYEVGGASSPEHEFQRHGGHEWGYVLSGKLGVTIGFEEHELGPGDSISIDSTVPHRLYNRGTVPVHGIWYVLGRRSLDVPGLRDE